jgi:hypothetical protein
MSLNGEKGGVQRTTLINYSAGVSNQHLVYKARPPLGGVTISRCSFYIPRLHEIPCDASLRSQLSSIRMPGMSGSILTPQDRAHFLGNMRCLTASPVHRRMNALLLLDDGWAAERVAAVLFIYAETVREHRRLYQVAGVAGVEQLKFEGSDPALSAEQLETLGAELNAALYASAKEDWAVQS